MNRIALRSHLRLASFVLCVLALTPSFAGAVTLTPVPDYAAGKIAMNVTYETECDQIRLYTGSQQRQVLTVAPAARSALTTSVSLPARTAFVIRGYAGGIESWSETVTIDPVTYRPRKPTIVSPVAAKVVNQYVDVKTTNTVPFTHVKARGDIWIAWQVRRMLPTKTWTMWSVRMPRGPARIDVYHRNGFGESPIASTVVYWVGSVPNTTRSVVVDKPFFAMYHIYSGKVVRWWPVALGMPGSPTPNGDFRIGGAAAASGPWGVLRRRLYRMNGVATSYYIHGTNEPWSIGTFASQGCVRMYNSDVLYFSRTVPNSTVVRIH